MKNNRKGFTIVELVIVIAVIGILAGVLIPTFSSITKSANESAALQQAKNGLQSILPLTGGSLPAGTVFAVNNDDDKTDFEFKFVYENQKLGANNETATAAATDGVYTLYVSTEGLTKNEQGAYDGIAADTLNMIKAIGVTLPEGYVVASSSGYFEIKTAAENGTLVAKVYYSSDIKATLVIALGAMD